MRSALPMMGGFSSMQALQVYDIYDMALKYMALKYMYISRLIIYICLDICDYLYLTGVCVACITGATCCCVLSKVIEIYISTCIYLYINICIYIYMGWRKKYINLFL